MVYIPFNVESNNIILKNSIEVIMIPTEKKEKNQVSVFKFLQVKVLLRFLKSIKQMTISNHMTK